MKEIVVPSPVQLVDQQTGTKGQTLSFRDWAFLTWFIDPRWHLDLARFVVVVQEFNSKRTPGDKLKLEDADYALLAAIVKAPQGTPMQPLQPPLLAMQMESFKILVLKAGDAALPKS